MTLEQQVCSLELAKRLKELEVKQDSLWSWCKSVGKPWNGNEKGTWNLQLDGPEENEPNSTECVSAFTVAELGLLLPWAIESRFLEDQDKWLKIEKDENVDDSVRWNVSYQDEMGTDLFDVFDSSEADARAKMLIYLIENKIITL